MIRRVLAGAGLAVVAAVAIPAVALAQPAPQPPPTAECGFLSAVVCQVVVPVGPIEILPNGINPGSTPGPPIPVIPTS